MTTIKTNEENDDWIFFVRDDNFCEICKIDKNRNLISFKRFMISHLENLKEGIIFINAIFYLEKKEKYHSKIFFYFF